MDILSSFLSSFASPPRHSSGEGPEQFLGQIFTAPPLKDSPLLAMLAGGNISAFTPWSFDIKYLDCFLILYTRTGCGKLVMGNQVHTLADSSFLFLDCGERFRLDIAVEPWEYQVFFITGDSLPWYYSLLGENNPLIVQLPLYSPASMAMERLLAHIPDESISSALYISSLLNQIITSAIACSLEDSSLSGSTPAYLEGMRTLFDNEFQESYTLDDLERRFNVSKYRLCREFGEAYGMPPLQYLNHRRIEMARHLLLTTDYRIHEIGSRVGIDTTNHFINLFKKYVGCTPGEYKQRMTT